MLLSRFSASRLESEIKYGAWSESVILCSLALSFKAKAILSVLKANYINHLVTDEATILKVLELDGDQQFTKK